LEQTKSLDCVSIRASDVLPSGSGRLKRKKSNYRLSNSMGELIGKSFVVGVNGNNAEFVGLVRI